MAATTGTTNQQIGCRFEDNANPGELVRVTVLSDRVVRPALS